MINSQIIENLNFNFEFFPGISEVKVEELKNEESLTIDKLKYNNLPKKN